VRCHPILPILGRDITENLKQALWTQPATSSFICSCCILSKLATIFVTCSASSPVSAYKSNNVASDNYQGRKKTVHNIKANVRSVAHQFSHSRALVDCLVDDMLLQTRPCSNQAPLQISNFEYGRAVDMLLHDAPDFIVHGIQVGTVRWPWLYRKDARCCEGLKCRRVTQSRLSWYILPVFNK